MALPELALMKPAKTTPHATPRVDQPTPVVKTEPGLKGGKRRKESVKNIPNGRKIVRNVPKMIPRGHKVVLRGNKVAVKREQGEGSANRLRKVQQKTIGKSVAVNKSAGRSKVQKKTVKNREIPVKVDNAKEKVTVDDDVAIEYEEVEESKCPYCMKQFSCWNNVSSHMIKMHATQV
jgi:hypothetical protein